MAKHLLRNRLSYNMFMAEKDNIISLYVKNQSGSKILRFAKNQRKFSKT